MSNAKKTIVAGNTVLVIDAFGNIIAAVVKNEGSAMIPGINHLNFALTTIARLSAVMKRPSIQATEALELTRSIESQLVQAQEHMVTARKAPTAPKAFRLSTFERRALVQAGNEFEGWCYEMGYDLTSAEAAKTFYGQIAQNVYGILSPASSTPVYGSVNTILEAIKTFVSYLANAWAQVEQTASEQQDFSFDPELSATSAQGTSRRNVGERQLAGATG